MFKTGHIPLTLCLMGVLTSVQSFTPSRWCTKQQFPLFMSPSDEKDTTQERQQDRLLSLLTYIQNRKEVSRSPCGLDANEKEQELVSSVITQVEQDAEHNLVSKQNGKIAFEELNGDWKLLYTSSRSMIINKSLSGLGRSASKYSQFVSLVQKLGGSKFLGKVEFLELCGQEEDTQMEVSITGEWYTKPENRLVTSEPTTSIVVDLEKVVYGRSSNNAQGWPSLGPIRVLDLLYLSQDMMVSQCNVNPESLFVWQRV